ncbi:MAG: hypothetical protein Q9160_009246 [Pyrenula sp. 1 TL-2023]
MPAKSTRSTRRKVHFEDLSAASAAPRKTSRKSNNKEAAPRKTSGKKTPAKRAPARKTVQQDNQGVETTGDNAPPQTEVVDSDILDLDDILAGNVAATSLQEDVELPPPDRTPQQRNLEDISFIVVTWIKVMCDGKQIYANFLGKFPRKDIQMECINNETEANYRLAKVKDLSKQNVQWDFNAIIVADMLKARKEIMTVDILDPLTWNKLDELMLIEYNKYKRDINLTCEFRAICTPQEEASVQQPTVQQRKRPHFSIISSDSVEPSSPAPRRSRSTFLTAQNEAKADIYERIGRHEIKLTDKWLCKEPNCRNCNNLCWVNLKRQHYLIKTPQLESWANAINSGEASISNPPQQLYEYWLVTQGPVDRESKTSFEAATRQDKQDKSERLFNMMERSMEMSLFRSIGDQMNRLNAQEYLPPQQHQYYSAPSPLPPPPPSAAAANPPISRSQSVAPPDPQSHSAGASAEQNSPRSSPLAGPEQEQQCIQDFFEWKLNRASRALHQELIEKAFSIVDNNMWGLEDLRGMEEGKSAAYKIAIQQGMPDGIARSFRRELRLFKPDYRASQSLQSLKDKVQR